MRQAALISLALGLPCLTSPNHSLQTVNTAAIQKAIQAAGASPSGGTVLFPPGPQPYMTGALNVTSLSNVTLWISSGASLYASDDPLLYQCVVSVTSDSGPCDYPFLFIYNSSNILLGGGGSINGGANDPPGHLVQFYNEVW